MTARYYGRLKGRTSPELIIGETLDISGYLDIGLYDRVWFKEDSGLRETHIVQLLGISQKVGSLMSYWIILTRGIPVSKTTKQHVTYLKTCTDSSKQHFKLYDKATKERFHNKYTEESFIGPNITKPTMEMWYKLADDDKDFQIEFKKVFDSCDVKEADK